MMNKNRIIVLTAGVLAVLALVTFGVVFTQAKSSDKGKTLVNINDESASYKSVCREEAGLDIVLMKDNNYEPKDFSIKKCTRVVFKNASSELHWPASDIHPTHGIYPEFDPKQPVVAGSEWSFVFDRVGVWKYHDHLKPIIRGVIEVSE